MREMNRIDDANERIKNKLVSQKTHYPVYKFEQSAEEKERIKRNMLFNSSKDSLISILILLSILDRYERNNFFVGVDPSLLENSNQRIFSVESPYSNNINLTQNSRILNRSTTAGSRPRTAQSNRSKSGKPFSTIQQVRNDQHLY
jgi:hypothetical protein